MTLYGRIACAVSVASLVWATADAVVAWQASPPAPDGVAAAQAEVQARLDAGDAAGAARAMHRLGDRYFNAMRYEDALATLTAAAAVAERIGDLDELGTIHNSLGRVYRVHGRLDEALRLQLRALELHRRAGSERSLAQSLNAVSAVYQRLAEYGLARQYLSEAIAVAQRGQPPEVLDFLQANMAAILSNLGEHAQAASMLEEVIARGRDPFPAVRQVQLSSAYAALRRHDDASRAAEAALTQCGAQDECVPAQLARAAARAGLGQMAEALADVDGGLARLEDLRRRLLPSDYARRNFSGHYQQAYALAIDLQLQAARPRAALEAAELARSRAFLDLLASRALPAMPSRTNEAAGIAASADDLVALASRLGSTLILYWVGPSDTIVWVVSTDGTIDARRVPVTRTRLADLVRQTTPFAAGVPTAAPTTTPAPAIRTRGSRATALRPAGPAWRELYQLLIAPIRTMLPATPGALLTIVPHDSLAGLSFAALQNERGRYLLEDFALHYAPAGALFRFTAPSGRGPTAARGVLALADPTPPDRSPLDEPLPRLPGARREVSAVRAAMKGAADVHRDRDASEARLRAEAGARDVLHLATHAVIREDDPFASFLALAPTDATTGDGDGRLTAEEIYGLRLNASLVVLSACRSAAGQVPGDGVATFARAFLYAGTSTLIASLWDVADEPTNQLLPGFYRGWQGGRTKADALRRAQLALLADLRAGRVRVDTPIGPVPVPEHPVFWAGFSLFGEP